MLSFSHSLKNSGRLWLLLFSILVVVHLPGQAFATDTKCFAIDKKKGGEIGEVPCVGERFKDPEESKSLFELAEALNGYYQGVKKKVCNLLQPDPAKTQASKPKPDQELFKSTDEMRRYIQCYATQDGRYDAFAKKYLPLIKEAAKAYNIPETLLACLIFRESQFDVDAKSYSGAMGLGQHLPGTMNYITNALKPQKPEAAEKMMAISSRTIEENAKVNQVSYDQARDDMKFAKTKLKLREQMLQWEEYYKGLKHKKLFSSKAPIPRDVNPRTIKDPKIAIGATGLYLRTILDHFKKVLPSGAKSGDGDTDYFTLLAAAGAYNMGPGAAAEMLAPIKPANAEKWIEKLMKSNEETAGYITSIRNCARSSTSPGRVSAFKAPVGDFNYECNDGNEAREPRVIIGPKTELPAEFRNKVKTAAMTEGPSAVKKTSAETKKKTTAKESKK